MYDVTHGQPWLVNAIAREIVVKRLGNDASQPILTKYVKHAFNTKSL